MKFIKTKLDGVIVIEPTIYRDERGYFFESFNQKEFEKHIGNINFIQDNESKSVKGVLRGLHFQKTPFEQAKLVRCIEGRILDVCIDLRKNSDTFGQYFSIELNDKNKKQVFIPRGLAHGFVVLSDKAIFSYKVDNYYAPNYEDGIIWNDEDLTIDWKINEGEIILSQKDKHLKKLKEII